MPIDPVTVADLDRACAVSNKAAKSLGVRRPGSRFGAVRLLGPLPFFDIDEHLPLAEVMQKPVCRHPLGANRRYLAPVV